MTRSLVLPLLTRTPAAWALGVLADPVVFLGDHAHLERKAANNALSMLARWPEDRHAARWTSVLTTIAKDETRHLGQVLRLLAARGGALPRHHANPYANELQALVRTGLGPLGLVDRLLVSALIEARSCERFQALSHHSPDPELAEFFGGLLRSEEGHYRAFLRLADLVRPKVEVATRWEELLDLEAAILERQETGPRMHSGIPSSSPLGIPS